MQMQMQMQMQIVVCWASALKVDPHKDVGIKVESKAPKRVSTRASV
jgi:hypothetical protein